MASLDAGGSATPHRRFRPGLLVYGLLLALTGVVALLLPMVASFAAGAAFGWLLLLLGLGGIGTVLSDRRAPGAVWRLIWSALALVAGVCAVWHPFMGALSATLVIGLALIGQGGVATLHALSHRLDGGRAWGWMAIAGVLTAALGAWLLLVAPHASLMLPGYVLGFGLLGNGAALLAAAFARAR